MNFSSDKSKKRIASLEITPLVDVVFLLLIFFLLTATYVKNPNIDIKLPKASAQNIFTKDKDILIAIKKDGTLLIDEHDVTVKILKKKLLKYKKIKGKETVVIMRADKGTRHGRVVEVMDIVKKAGFSKLAIAVKEKEQSK